jgi:peptidoglycan/LPS O-acetylase OafA/YrhL
MQPFKFLGEAGPINANLSWFLDISRALAAFLVVIGHVKTIVFGESTWATNYLSNVFALITGLGHQGVVIFFVLSGFLVGRKAVDAVVRRKSNLGHYILDRATRIYVVLIPAILIGAMWDWILINQLDNGDAYTYIQHRYDFIIA